MRKFVEYAPAIDIVPLRANHAGRLAHPNRRTNRKIAGGGFRFEYCSPTTVRSRILRAQPISTTVANHVPPFRHHPHLPFPVGRFGRKPHRIYLTVRDLLPPDLWKHVTSYLDPGEKCSPISIGRPIRSRDTGTAEQTMSSRLNSSEDRPLLAMPNDDLLSWLDPLSSRDVGCRRQKTA
jgi:hypothetical protein